MKSRKRSASNLEEDQPKRKERKFINFPIRSWDLNFDDGSMAPVGMTLLISDQFRPYSLSKLCWFAKQLKVFDWQDCQDHLDLTKSIVRRLDIMTVTDSPHVSFDPDQPTIYIIRENASVNYLQPSRHLWKYNNGVVFYSAFWVDGKLKSLGYYYPEIRIFYEFSSGLLDVRGMKCSNFTIRDTWDRVKEETKRILYNSRCDEISEDLILSSVKSFILTINNCAGIIIALAEIILSYICPIGAREVNWPGMK